MTSMRKLNRRLRVWQRYTRRYPEQVPAKGHQRAALAVATEQDRRFWDETPEIWLGGPAGEAALVADVLGCCDVCGLPDSYRGQGDGIGSCDCPRCDCGVARSSSFCTCDPACSYCLSKTCEGDCDEAFADELDDDALPADADYAWHDGRAVPVETVTVAEEVL